MIIPFKSPDPLDEFSDLYSDVKSLSDHELRLTIGAARRPSIPYRSVHPIVAQFPSVGDAEYQALLEDIRKNGQRKAVCMFQGMIWDGRARYDACVALGLVPRVWSFNRGDPTIYLLERHRDRFGLPRTPERTAALALLDKIESKEWKAEAVKRRDEWIADARRGFAERHRMVPQPCAVCGLAGEYSHAHHSLPLSVQYSLGVDEPVQDHDWLCHVHHKLIHQRIGAHLIGSRQYAGDDYAYRYKSPEDAGRAAAALDAVFEKARRLFVDVGGVPVRGNWAMLSP